MKVISKMEKNMEKESILKEMHINMMENIKMIRNMVLDKNLIMEINIADNGKIIRNKVKEHGNLNMVENMKVHL